MVASSEILKLSNMISEKTAELDQYLKATSQPSASSTNALPPTPLPPQQMQARAELFDAMSQLKTLLQTPMERLVDIVSFEYTNTMPAVEMVVKYDVASNLEVEKEVTYQVLSEKCQLNETDLRRVMRMLISKGVFDEPSKGVVKHNSISRLLSDSQAIRDWLAYSVKYLWPVSFFTTDALSKWPDGQETQETAYYLLRGETFWNSLRNESNARFFTAAMEFLQNNPQFGSHHLVDGLGWDRDGGKSPSLMVDVGGHNGSIAADILRRYPIAKCIVQDRPDVIASAHVPDDLQGRLEFQEHDFFTTQPIRAEVYLLRSICHDWSDKYARQIISNLIPALNPGARVVINEVCMPDPGQIPQSVESTLRYVQTFDARKVAVALTRLRAYDICMKQLFNARERDIEEWQALFEACDKRFKLLSVNVPPGSALAIMEFEWTG